MRVLSRVALVVLLVILAVPAAFADHLTPECPLTLAGGTPPATSFNLSPHGVFRNGNSVFVLRGQTLTTYNVTDLGDVQVLREDFIGSLGARETNGGTAFANGFLYVSGEAGLEVYDLRNVRAGGGAPILLTRIAGLHYRRLVINGTQLAGLYPATDLPCAPSGTVSSNCNNTVDLYNIATPASPVRVAQITSAQSGNPAYNDIAYSRGYLFVTSDAGTFSYNVSNPAAISTAWSYPTPGTFLVTSGSTNGVLAVGSDSSITVFTINTDSMMVPFGIYTLPALTIERANPIMFHPQAFLDESNARLITMIDELDPATLHSARTIAFDIFDFTVGFDHGSDPRPNEVVSYVSPDEVKFNPTAVGSYVYVVGERSGMQSYGSCNIVTGHIDWDGTTALTCAGAEIHGWVTGTQKIANVELFLDAGSLGSATLGGPPRIDVPSPNGTPITAFRINVNLDATTRGEHILRAIGTDALGNRKQFASQRVFFQGPGLNCTARRRTTGK
jgi:hypothetical protein